MNAVGAQSADRYECPGCGYMYDEGLGEPHEGLVPGTRFTQVPRDLTCPDCGVREFQDFERRGDGQTSPRT